MRRLAQQAFWSMIIEAKVFQFVKEFAKCAENADVWLIPNISLSFTDLTDVSGASLLLATAYIWHFFFWSKTSYENVYDNQFLLLMKFIVLASIL